MTKIVIDINKRMKEIKPLPYSADNGLEHMSINNHYFEKNKEPWYPIMGEFHYTRFDEKEWTREIAKMKSGGVDVVASYVIWIHHEEVQGEFDFTGQRNLRLFIKKCQEEGVYFFLRIGPWAHGEVRNGGLPDWVQHGGYELRSNNEEYLKHVRSYFEKVYKEVKGLFFKDGGPIIGLQIENEYGHAGGFRGEKGDAHMRQLKKMLVEIGFDVPFYTATAWGGGVVVDGETLPVFGGYVDAPWSYSLEALPANSNFVFSPIFNDPLIASDFLTEGIEFETFDFEIEDYPYLTAELGGGLQVTKIRRPLVSAKDTEVQAMVKLGSGANLLGYYMYHGGTNPLGKLTTLEETRATGSHTDVPKLSYDFQAPLGEYGIINESYGTLRKLHLFVKQFEVLLAKSEVQFAKDLVHDPEDTENLRYNVRIEKESQSGFVFINNYQRLRELTSKEANFVIKLEDEEIVLPKLILENGDTAILPFNIKQDRFQLKSSSASLMTIINDNWIFYHPRPSEAEVVFNGEEPNIILLSEEEANKAFRMKNQLYISDADLWEEDSNLIISSYHTEVKVWNRLENTKETVTFETDQSSVVYKKERDEEDHTWYWIDITYSHSPDAADLLLNIDFTGDKAELYDESGSIVADWFATGKEWLVSLKTLSYPTQLKVKVFPTVKETYYEVPMKDGCEVKAASLSPLYRKNLE